VLEVVQYIERNVFSFFTPAFLKEYMPRNVLLVDSLISVYEHSDDVSEEYWTKDFAITGAITDKYLVIGNVGERFNPATPGLQEELLSLFVEYFFNNNRMPPVPDGVKAATEKAATDVGAVIYLAGAPFSYNYPYWDGKKSASAAWNGVGVDSTATPWLGRGILKIGRAGKLGYEHAVFSGLDVQAYSFQKGTLAQDFADFVAFILFHPPAEREAFYAQVEADSRVNTYPGYDPDPRFPYAGPAGASAMRTKDAIIKAYIRERFGIQAE
jgi:hypothetical protein